VLLLFFFKDQSSNVKLTTDRVRTTNKQKRMKSHDEYPKMIYHKNRSII